jgi:hypothetical protein
VTALALAHLACGPAHEPSPGPDEPWTIAKLKPRSPLVPEEMFPSAKGLYVFDSDSILLLAPKREEEWSWPEHPAGVVTIRTNNLGLLESVRTSQQKAGSRVLVAGDSHLMVVDAEESFPNLVEQRLRNGPYPDSEVLSSGVGYTSPPLHLQRLRRFLYLDPDVFVLSVFTGNDFLDQLTLDYDLGKSSRPDLGEGYNNRLSDCRSRALYQGLNQTHFFVHWPGTEQLALDNMLAVFEETRALCEEKEIELVVVLLPTKFDVDGDDDEAMAQALTALELGDDDRGANRRLALRLAQALEQRGIRCVDPFEAIRDEPEPCFWRKDYHLSSKGHAMVAQVLHGTILALLDGADGADGAGR